MWKVLVPLIAALAVLFAASPASAEEQSLPPQLTGTPPTLARIGEPYSYQFTAEGADSVRLMSDRFPAGLTWDSETLTLSGTPTPQASGTFSYSLIARNAVNFDKETYNLSLVGSMTKSSEFYSFPGQGTHAATQTCPASHPYLMNERSWKPIEFFLPNGVSVDVTSNGYSFSGDVLRSDGYATGVQNLKINLAWAVGGSATVNLQCSNDANAGY